jgi:hypothetical protein
METGLAFNLTETDLEDRFNTDRQGVAQRLALGIRERLLPVLESDLHAGQDELPKSPSGRRSPDVSKLKDG